jgi:cytochrome c biogenesis protein CcdA
MEAPFVAAATAVWLGILTSISPCPLASNVVAIAYIGKGLANTRRVIMAGLLYTAGRMFTYAVLGVLLAASLASIVGVSNALQRHMNQLLGPVLIIAGMFVLELLKWNPGTGGIGERVQRGADRWGLWGAAERRPGSDALLVRHRHRAAGAGLRIFGGPRSRRDRFRLRPRGARRVVGAPCHRRGLHRGGRVLLAHVHL